jgi:hypothetical protein
MARVSDVRMLGATQSDQPYPYPAPRSKAGRQISMSMRTASLPANKQQPSLLASASLAGEAGKPSTWHDANATALNTNPASRSGLLRPASSHGTLSMIPRTRKSSAASAAVHTAMTIKFAEPGGSMGSMQRDRAPDRYDIVTPGRKYGETLQAAHAHVAEAGEYANEDVLDVLHRRIEQQRNELRKHREHMELAVSQDVASLQHVVESDRRELKDVHHRYREALDELARLRAALCEGNDARDDVEAELEEARAEVRQLKDEMASREDAYQRDMCRMLEAVRCTHNVLHARKFCLVQDVFLLGVRAFELMHRICLRFAAAFLSCEHARGKASMHMLCAVTANTVRFGAGQWPRISMRVFTCSDFCNFISVYIHACVHIYTHKQAKHEAANALQSRLEASQQALTEAKEEASKVPGLQRIITQQQDSLSALQDTLRDVTICKQRADQAAAELVVKLRQVEDAQAQSQRACDARMHELERDYEAQSSRLESERMQVLRDGEGLSVREGEIESVRAECVARIEAAERRSSMVCEQLEALKCELAHRNCAVQFAAEQVRMYVRMYVDVCV